MEDGKSRNKLYNYLKNKGKYNGDEASFNAGLDSESGRVKLYNYMKDKGMFGADISLEQFHNQLKPEVTPETTVTTDTQSTTSVEGTETTPVATTQTQSTKAATPKVTTPKAKTQAVTPPPASTTNVQPQQEVQEQQVFTVGGKEFNTEAEAKAYQDQLNKQAQTQPQKPVSSTTESARKYYGYSVEDANNTRKNVYERAKAKGYQGDYAHFTAELDTKAGRKKFYDLLSGDLKDTKGKTISYASYNKMVSVPRYYLNIGGKTTKVSEETYVNWARSHAKEVKANNEALMANDPSKVGNARLLTDNQLNYLYFTRVKNQDDSVSKVGFELDRRLQAKADRFYDANYKARVDAVKKKIEARQNKIYNQRKNLPASNETDEFLASQAQTVGDPGKDLQPLFNSMQKDMPSLVLRSLGLDANGKSGKQVSKALTPQQKKENELINQAVQKEASILIGQLSKKIGQQMMGETFERFMGSPAKYIASHVFTENFVSKLINSVSNLITGDSGLRNQWLAQAYEDYGKSYSPVVTGTAEIATTMADMALGGFELPNLASKLTSSAIKSAIVKKGATGVAEKLATAGVTNEQLYATMLAKQGPLKRFFTDLTVSIPSNFAMGATLTAQNQVLDMTRQNNWDLSSFGMGVLQGGAQFAPFGIFSSALGSIKMSSGLGTTGKRIITAASLPVEATVLTAPEYVSYLATEGDDKNMGIEYLKNLVLVTALKVPHAKQIWDQDAMFNGSLVGESAKQALEKNYKAELDYLEKGIDEKYKPLDGDIDFKQMSPFIKDMVNKIIRKNGGNQSTLRADDINKEIKKARDAEYNQKVTELYKKAGADKNISEDIRSFFLTKVNEQHPYMFSGISRVTMEPSGKKRYSVIAYDKTGNQEVVHEIFANEKDAQHRMSTLQARVYGNAVDECKLSYNSVTNKRSYMIATRELIENGPLGTRPFEEEQAISNRVASLAKENNWTPQEAYDEYQRLYNTEISATSKEVLEQCKERAKELQEKEKAKYKAFEEKTKAKFKAKGYDIDKLFAERSAKGPYKHDIFKEDELDALNRYQQELSDYVDTVTDRNNLLNMRDTIRDQWSRATNGLPVLADIEDCKSNLGQETTDEIDNLIESDDIDGLNRLIASLDKESGEQATATRYMNARFAEEVLSDDAYNKGAWSMGVSKRVEQAMSTTTPEGRREIGKRANTYEQAIDAETKAQIDKIINSSRDFTQKINEIYDLTKDNENARKYAESVMEYDSVVEGAINEARETMKAMQERYSDVGGLDGSYILTNYNGEDCLAFMTKREDGTPGQVKVWHADGTDELVSLSSITNSKPIELKDFLDNAWRTMIDKPIKDALFQMEHEPGTKEITDGMVIETKNGKIRVLRAFDNGDVVAIRIHDKVVDGQVVEEEEDTPIDTTKEELLAIQDRGEKAPVVGVNDTPEESGKAETPKVAEPKAESPKVAESTPKAFKDAVGEVFTKYRLGSEVDVEKILDEIESINNNTIKNEEIGNIVNTMRDAWLGMDMGDAFDEKDSFIDELEKGVLGAVEKIEHVEPEAKEPEPAEPSEKTPVEQEYDDMVLKAKGNEETAQKLIDYKLKSAKDRLKEAEKQKPAEGLSDEEFIAEQERIDKEISDAQAEIDKLNEMKNIPTRRAEAENQAKADAEARAKADAERIEAEKRAKEEELKAQEEQQQVEDNQEQEEVIPENPIEAVNEDSSIPERVKRVNEEVRSNIGPVGRPQFIDKVANKIGFRVIYEHNGVNGENGHTDFKNKIIYLNADKPELVETTTGHELTHALKREDMTAYGLLVEKVKEQLGDEFQTKYDERLELYSADPKARASMFKEMKKAEDAAIEEARSQGLSEEECREAGKQAAEKAQEDYITEEVVCDFAGDMFHNPLQMQKMIGDVLDKAPTGIGAFKKWISHVFDILRNLKFGSKRYAENYAEAEQIWNDMLRTAVAKNRGNEEVDVTDRESVDTLCNAVGMRFVTERDSADGKNHLYLDMGNGKIGAEIKTVKAEHIRRSPMGALIHQAWLDGTISKQQYDDTLKNQAEILNYLKDMDNVDMFFTICGAIDYEQLKGEARNVARDYYKIDSKGKVAFVPFKSNSEAQYHTTWDATTICRKTQTAIDMISQAMMDTHHGLTTSEIIKIVYKNIYQESKGEVLVPCNVCYVFNRWVNLGNLFDSMNRLQKMFPEDMAIEDVIKAKEDADNNLASFYGKRGQKRIETLLTKKRTKDESKELGQYIKGRREYLQERIDQINRKQFNYEATEPAKRKQSNALTDAEEQEREQLLREQALLDKSTWFEYVRLHQDENGNYDYKQVPEDVLFNINNSAVFKTQYPGAWKYRTTRGSGMGKAAAAYAPEYLGTTIVGQSGNLEGTSDPTNLANDVFLTRDENGHYEYIDEDTWTLKPKALIVFRKAQDANAAQNYLNGQRLQSTSDTRREYLTDYSLHFLQQMVTGCAEQGFTKVPETAQMLLDAGSYINFSLIPKGKGYEIIDKETYDAMSDEDKRDCAVVNTKDGDVVMHAIYSDASGINHQDAFALNDAYDNGQCIMVCVNRDHLKLCMKLANTGRITFNIPYHKSGDTGEFFQAKTEAIGEHINLDERDDFEDYQNDTVIPKEKYEEAGHPELYEEKKLAREIFKDIKQGVTYDTANGEDAEKIALLQKPEYYMLHQLYQRWAGQTVTGEPAKIENRFLLPEDRDTAGKGYGAYDSRTRTRDWNTTTGEYLQDKDGNPVYKRVTMGGAQAAIIMPHDYWDNFTTLETADRNGKIFTDFCDMLGYYPRFSGNAKGKYDASYDMTKEPGYWSTLIDIAMYDRQGKRQFQKPVDASKINGVVVDGKKKNHFDYAQGTILNKDGIQHTLTEMKANPKAESPIYQQIREKNKSDIDTKREQETQKLAQAWNDYKDYEKQYAKDLRAFNKAEKEREAKALAKGKEFKPKSEPKKISFESWLKKNEIEFDSWVRDEWNNNPEFVKRVGDISRDLRNGKVLEGFGLSMPEDTKYSISRKNASPDMQEALKEMDTPAGSEEEQRESDVRYSIVRDKKEIDRLNKEKTFTAYHSMQLIRREDGKLYLFPPMAAMVDGEYVEGIPVSDDLKITPMWEKSDEHPELAHRLTVGDSPKAVPEDAELEKQIVRKIVGKGKNAKLTDVTEYYYSWTDKKGKLHRKQVRTDDNGDFKYYFALHKGNKDDNGGNLTDLEHVAYDPYMHSTTSPLNDQFTTAYKRSHLVTVKVEIPVSELNGDYKAERAALATGSHDWKGGNVAKGLKGEDARKVILSRWDKPIEIVSDAEVAEKIKGVFDRNGIKEMPFNVVTPSVREELQKLGVKIGKPTSGNAGDEAIPAYEEWLKSQGPQGPEPTGTDPLERFGLKSNGPQTNKALNVANTKDKFADKIISGEKTIETRTPEAWKRMQNAGIKIGDRLAIVDGGKIKGYVTLADVKEYKNAKDFYGDKKLHGVEPGTKYSWEEQGKKVGLILSDPEPASLNEDGTYRTAEKLNHAQGYRVSDDVRYSIGTSAKSGEQNSTLTNNKSEQSDKILSESERKIQEERLTSQRIAKEFMTDESRKRSYESHKDDPNFAHPEIAFLSDGSKAGAKFTASQIMSIPEIQKAQEIVNNKESKKGPNDKPESLKLTEDRVKEYSERLLSEGSFTGKVDGKEQFNGPVDRERKAFIIIGRPAGGKSSVYANPYSAKYHARIIDSDEAKTFMPEFDGGYGAGYVQNASADVANTAFKTAIANGDNIVLPKIGGNTVLKQAIGLKNMGYSVTLLYNDVPEEVSYTRAAARFAETGRYLSQTYLTGIGEKAYRTLTIAGRSYLDIIKHLAGSGDEEYIKLYNDIKKYGERSFDRGTGEQNVLAGSSDAGRHGGQSGSGQGNNSISSQDASKLWNILNSKIFDYIEWKDNDVKVGEKPKLVWTSESGAPLPVNPHAKQIEQQPAEQKQPASNNRTNSTDKDYFQAVRSGDEGALRELVSKAAKAAGYTHRSFHGSINGGFRVIDLSNAKDGKSFFSTSREKVAESYANDSNALIDTYIPKVKSISDAKLALSPYNIGVGKYYFVVDKDGNMAPHSHSNYSESAAITEMSNIAYWKNKTPEELGYQIKNTYAIVDDPNGLSSVFSLYNTEKETVDAVNEKIQKGELKGYRAAGIKDLYVKFDRPLKIDAKGARWNQIKWTDKDGNEYVGSTNDIATYAKEHDHDGVIIDNVVDNSYSSDNDMSSVYISFEPNKVKSAETITYDNKGKIIPLSQRFNDDRSDIRYSISKKESADYMKAAESGDEKTAGELVKAAAKKAMPDTKVVDENGNPMVVYHGTDKAGFHQFNNKDGAIWATPSKDFATVYARNSTLTGEGFSNGIYPVYMDIKNPIFAGKIDDSCAISKDYTKLCQQLGVDDYKLAEMCVPNDWIKFVSEAESEGYEGDGAKEVALMSIPYYAVTGSKRFAEFAKSKGYDGIEASEITNNSSANIVNTYAVFDSSQIKSAEPITRDDEGNIIPLDERFSGSDDIRYSISAAKDPSQRIIDEVKELLDREDMPEMYKSNLNQLMYNVKNATEENLDTELAKARRTIYEVKSRGVRRETSDLLNIKTTDKTQRGIRKGVNVDATTADVLKDVKERMKSFFVTDYDQDLKQLRSQGRELQKQLTKLEYTLGKTTDDAAKLDIQEQIGDINDQINKNAQDIKDITEKRNALIDEGISSGSYNIEEELEALRAKLDDAAEGTGFWTQKDSAKEEALNIVGQYLDGQKAAIDIRQLQDDLKKMEDKRKGYYQQYKDGKISYTDYREKSAGIATEKNAQYQLIEEAYKRLYDNDVALNQSLRDLITGGQGSFQDRARLKQEHKRDLLRHVFDDIVGNKVYHGEIDKDSEGKKKSRDKEHWAKTMFTRSLGSFEYITQAMAKNSLGEESFLYKYFVTGKHGVLAAQDDYLRSSMKQVETLDNKCKEIFGTNFKDASNENSKYYIHSGVYRLADINDPKSFQEEGLTKGQATYIYMVWKMPDGRSKLQLQGFTEESMRQIVNFIGRKNVEFADWAQNEFFKKAREKYSKKYQEIYGCDMAEIPDYVPLKILKEDVRENSGLADGSGKQPQTTIQRKTGSLIERRVNTSKVDFTHSAFDIIANHVDQMEEWCAFADVRQDLDTVLNSKFFRNQVNLNSRGMYNRFRSAAEVAVHANNTETGTEFDTAFAKFTKGVVAANISFRNTTAMKQILSVPAFLGYSQDPRFLAGFAKNVIGEYGASALGIGTNMLTFGTLSDKMFKNTAEQKAYLKSGLSSTVGWCMRELPDFYDRVLKGTAGDNILDEKGWDSAIGRLLDGYTQKGMSTNKMVDAVTCAVGIKTIYDYKYARLREQGVEPEEAKRQALMEAKVYYNGTQQASQPAFLSPMQASRSFLDKTFSVYQNANIGYARKLAEASQDLFRIWMNNDRLRDNYTKQLVEQGMNEKKARQLAEERFKFLGNDARKKLFNIVHYGFTLNRLWDVGGKGLLGWITGQSALALLTGINKDDEDTVEAMKYMYLASVPFRGLAGMNMLSTWMQGAKFNPMVAVDDLNRFSQEFTKITKEEGLVSWEMAGLIGGKLSRMSGIDPKTWCNTYLGVEAAVRDGINLAQDKDTQLLTDLMLMMNTPESNREQVVKTWYGDYYKEKMEGAENASPKMKNRIRRACQIAYAEKVLYACKYFDAYKQQGGEDEPILARFGLIGKNMPDSKYTELAKELTKNIMSEKDLELAEKNIKKKEDLKNATTSEEAIKLLDKDNTPEFNFKILKKAKELVGDKSDSESITTLSGKMDETYSDDMTLGGQDISDNQETYIAGLMDHPDEIKRELDIAKKKAGVSEDSDKGKVYKYTEQTLMKDLKKALNNAESDEEEEKVWKAIKTVRRMAVAYEGTYDDYKKLFTEKRKRSWKRASQWAKEHEE